MFVHIASLIIAWIFSYWLVVSLCCDCNLRWSCIGPILRFWKLCDRIPSIRTMQIEPGIVPNGSQLFNILNYQMVRWFVIVKVVSFMAEWPTYQMVPPASPSPFHPSPFPLSTSRASLLAHPPASKFWVENRYILRHEMGGRHYDDVQKCNPSRDFGPSQNVTLMRTSKFWVENR